MIKASNITFRALSWKANGTYYLSLNVFLYGKDGVKYAPKCVQTNKAGAANTDVDGTITHEGTVYDLHVHSDYGCWDGYSYWRLEYLMDPNAYNSNYNTWMPNDLNDINKRVATVSFDPPLPISAVLCGTNDPRNTADSAVWEVSFNDGKYVQEVPWTGGGYNFLRNGTPTLIEHNDSVKIVRRVGKIYGRKKVG